MEKVSIRLGQDRIGQAERLAKRIGEHGEYGDMAAK
jgi:hypothetical protein